MISQQRFDELVAMANKGSLHVREAIKIAVHESLEIERSKVFKDLTRDMPPDFGIENYGVDFESSDVNFYIQRDIKRLSHGRNKSELEKIALMCEANWNHWLFRFKDYIGYIEDSIVDEDGEVSVMSVDDGNYQWFKLSEIDFISKTANDWSNEVAEDLMSERLKNGKVEVVIKGGNGKTKLTFNLIAIKNLREAIRYVDDGDVITLVSDGHQESKPLGVEHDENWGD